MSTIQALGLGWVVGSFGTVALWCLALSIRDFFNRGSRTAANFVAGKPAPLIKAQPRDKATGQFASKREVIHAALRRDVEAK